jgi:hypothetical protein
MATSPDLDRAEQLLGDFERFWDAERELAEQRKLIASLVDRIWQDDRTIVAVKPRPAFATYFTALDQAQRRAERARPERGVTKKRERRGVEPTTVTPQIEIRM